VVERADPGRTGVKTGRVVDGVLAGLDSLSPLYATAYFLAWLPYLPVFGWLGDPEAGDDRSGPRRLGDSRD
jgi:hypothetical protein